MTDQVTIRAGHEQDRAALFALLDASIAWMVARGQSDQWGSDPASETPAWRTYVDDWIAHPAGLRIAELNGLPVGASVVLGHAPDYIPAVTRPETYLLFLISDRDLPGRGIGAALVKRAVEDARANGSELLRVDCWAGAPALVAWYESQGFVRSGTYADPQELDWHGQIFEMEL